jgi:hypothetical protein
MIQAAYPGHKIIGEEAEGSNKYELTAGPTWTIDPIDGTTNFVHRIPYTCVPSGGGNVSAGCVRGLARVDDTGTVPRHWNSAKVHSHRVETLGTYIESLDIDPREKASGGVGGFFAVAC